MNFVRFSRRLLMAKPVAARLAPRVPARRFAQAAAAAPAAAAVDDIPDEASVGHLAKGQYPWGSKYPVPPVGDCLGLAFTDPTWDPEQNPLLPYTIDRSTGVSVMRFHAGKYAGEECVIAAVSLTLEWCLPSPPPEHCFEEPPIIKEPPHPNDPVQARGYPDIGVEIESIIPPQFKGLERQ